MSDLQFLTIVVIIILGFVTGIFVMVMGMVWEKAYPLTVMGQYSLSNYTSYDNNFKIFLLSKEKLNFTVLENENDITDKLLIFRIHS